MHQTRQSSPLVMRLHHQIKPLVFPVEHHLAEADVGGVIHDFPGDVVPHVIADQGLIQVGAIEGPFVMGMAIPMTEWSAIGAVSPL